jgi:hypothetical protein
MGNFSQLQKNVIVVVGCCRPCPSKTALSFQDSFLHALSLQDCPAAGPLFLVLKNPLKFFKNPLEFYKIHLIF